MKVKRERGKKPNGVMAGVCLVVTNRRSNGNNRQRLGLKPLIDFAPPILGQRQDLSADIYSKNWRTASTVFRFSGDKQIHFK